MKDKDFAELYDSAEDLIVSIGSYGSADEYTLRNEIARLSSSLSKVSSYVPDYSSMSGVDIDIKTNIGDESASSLTPEMLGFILSNLDPEQLGVAMRELNKKSHVKIVDTRLSGMIPLRVCDAQKAYQRLNGGICDIEKAKIAIDKVSNSFSPSISLNQQYREAFKEGGDGNLDALASLGFM